MAVRANELWSTLLLLSLLVLGAAAGCTLDDNGDYNVRDILSEL